jgi:hypothetical protein
MVLSAIFLVTAPAYAQPVNLACKESISENVRRATFDESLGTAFYSDDPASHAEFADGKVKWSGKFDFFYDHADFILDRMTGILVAYAPYDGGVMRVEFNCVAAEKKF